jgi:S-adenosylmethionine:tRNA ribosyltransferase-isomerase
MLVCAFFGTKESKNLYEYAIDNKMRFFSYGDAMLLHKSDNI